jgi:hypothetical protein
VIYADALDEDRVAAADAVDAKLAAFTGEINTPKPGPAASSTVPGRRKMKRVSSKMKQNPAPRAQT